MLLRRITQHVKEQNWTAIALDFVIVVVGVFIGIQVANWNDARSDRAEAQQLLVRLHEETSALLDLQKTEYATQAPRLELMSPIHTLLFDSSPQRPLTQRECYLIAVSHWLPSPTDELPILNQIISTGRVDLIANEHVKESLRTFALVRDRSRRQYAESTNELFRLSSRHPDAIWYELSPAGEIEDTSSSLGRSAILWERSGGEVVQWANACDLDAMRQKKAFLADYVDNGSRLNSYIRRYEELIEVLTLLNASLADELGLAEIAEKGDS